MKKNESHENKFWNFFLMKNETKLKSIKFNQFFHGILKVKFTHNKKIPLRNRLGQKGRKSTKKVKFNEEISLNLIKKIDAKFGNFKQR